ncbi:ATP-grasp fold amidoligase family protein [Nesterenkonia populi]|uniref:ATP-grasp fold amidoligase family protein n=1 Tax=Nesterenkonia populi TaxID=1591087 RepID=UPI0011BEECCC|nr:ATP-grasp fold amidoligase family protein [Nesterenkonia populi]
MDFDKADHESPYLSFLAAEFQKRGTKLRRTLSNKTKVHRMLREITVGGTHIGLPQQYNVLTSPNQITSESLGERAALKFAHGWSARGVMLLERTGAERYFDHFSLREWSLQEIREKQQETTASFPKKKPAWIIEEMLHGPQPGTIPFDYKFYMFQGQIGLVSQIDRNSSPLRNAFFDGNLNPLVEEQDFRLSSKIQPAAPLVPRSAVMLSRWAVELSQMTDAPFVRVDLYDTENGPYFGEFTFSSGAEHRRTIKFSRKMLNTFDHMFVNAEKMLNSDAVDLPESWSTLLQSTDSEALASQPLLSVTEYERLAHYLYNQGELGGFRLAEAQEALADHGADAAVNQYVSEAHRSAARWVKADRKSPPRGLREALQQVRKDHPPAQVIARKAHRTFRRLMQ